MQRSEPRLCELIDTDLPADELERLARVDAFLRTAVPSDGAGESVRPSLRLVTTQPAATASTHERADKQTHELKFTFNELALIYKSLQAAKTLGALPPQDELLDDTIELVDQALKRTV